MSNPREREADRLQEAPFKNKAFKALEEKGRKGVISQGLLLCRILSQQFFAKWFNRGKEKRSAVLTSKSGAKEKGKSPDQNE